MYIQLQLCFALCPYLPCLTAYSIHMITYKVKLRVENLDWLSGREFSLYWVIWENSFIFMREMLPDWPVNAEDRVHWQIR